MGRVQAPSAIMDSLREDTLCVFWLNREGELTAGMVRGRSTICPKAHLSSRIQKEYLLNFITWFRGRKERSCRRGKPQFFWYTVKGEPVFASQQGQPLESQEKPGSVIFIRKVLGMTAPQLLPSVIKTGGKIWFLLDKIEVFLQNKGIVGGSIVCFPEFYGIFWAIKKSQVL